MYTLQQIKDQYYHDLFLKMIERMELEAYIKEYFVRCYDIEGNLLGWEKSRVSLDFTK
jgi:hypothetical protein